MSWEELFERAEAYDVTVADVREALDDRRAERGESGDDGSAGGEDDG